MGNIINKLLGKASRMVTTKSNKLFSPMVPVSKEEVETHLSEAWQDPDVPQRQYDLFVKKQLEGYRNGQPLDVYDTITDIIKDNLEINSNTRLLEIGCSSGYYSEALKIKGI